MGAGGWAQADCPAGTHVSGGGFDIGSQDVLFSGPVPGTPGATPTGWLAFWVNPGSVGSANLIVYAICVNAAS